MQFHVEINVPVLHDTKFIFLNSTKQNKKIILRFTLFNAVYPDD
jgi:hypothetical protein